MQSRKAVFGVILSVAAFAEAEIDQKGCTFQPHVVIVAPGTNLHVLNSEHVAHKT